MKRLQFLSYVFLFGMFFNATGQESTKGVKSAKWTPEKRQQHLKNIEDATTWDSKKLTLDKQLLGYDLPGPFELGVWPVPKYELISGEVKVANGNNEAKFELEGQVVFMNSFYAVKNPVNEEYLHGREDEVFMHILVLSDTIKPDTQSVIWSRNYPDFYGQGSVKTKSATIEYASFLTAERSAFAIVNTRLFNLNYGKTILVAPQPDGTLRSMQIKSPELSNQTVKKYTAELLRREGVRRFFQKKK